MSTHQLAFINDNVNNWEALAANLPNDVTVVHLDSQRDGLHQIVDYLHDQSIQNLAAIHLLSHGASGQVQLGNLTLTQDNLATQHDLLSQLGQALTPDGDLLLYGCNVAQGQTGLDFIGQLAQITHADVAASNNLTGNAALGGDWILENTHGSVETTSLKIEKYFDATLGNVAMSTAVDAYTGTAGVEDIFVLPNNAVTNTGRDYVAYGGVYTGGTWYQTTNIIVFNNFDVAQDKIDVSALSRTVIDPTSVPYYTIAVAAGADFANFESCKVNFTTAMYSGTRVGNTVTTGTTGAWLEFNDDNGTPFLDAFFPNVDPNSFTLANFIFPTASSNTAPTITSGASGSVAENAATSTVVYTTTVTDPENDAITYALTGTDAAAFDISTTGVVTLKASADYETKSSYSIIVNASDAAHTASPTTKNVTINVSNVNEKPVITALASQNITQGVATALTGISVADPDSGANPITVSLSTAGGTFTSTTGSGVTVVQFINPTGRGLTIRLTGTQTDINNFINDSAMLGIDYIPTDTTGNVITGTVTLSITSDDGGSTGSGGTQTDSKTETVNIVPPNAAPIITSGVTGSVAENAPTNTVVYTATATDAENDAITYLLTGTDAAAFNVSVTGDITLKASADYETKPSYSITVNAKDADNTTRKTIDVNVTNVNDAPTDISLSPNRVVENTATTNALSIGTLTTIDQDAGDTFTYSIVGGADQASFQITGTDLQFKAGTTLDYETKSSYAVTVRSTDQGGLTYDKTLTINLTNVNEAPTAINFTSAGLDATTATANATAGALAAVDPDTGNTHTFTLVAGSGTNDADNSKFTITGSTLKVGGTPLAAGIYHVMTRATDAGGLSFDQAQTITITNPPPAPVLTPAPQIIDGVALQTLTTSNGGQQITIPLVSADRSEDKTTANSHLADIPLAKNTAGTTILNLGIPTGVGAIVSGTSSSISLGEAKNELIRQIEAKTTQDSDSRSSMSTDGLQFLSALTSSDTLRVQTITPSVDKTTQTITTPIVITATPQIDGSKQAIVLDTQQLPSKTPITVNNIDFISVVGSARITGGAGANIAVGDNEDQFIVLGADDDELHGGGGTDTIGSLTGNDKLYGDGGNDVVYGGAGNDTLDGGSGNNVLNGGFGQDTALLAGTLADYQVTLINSNQIQLTHRTTGATNTLIDIETVTFTGNQETWQLTYTPGKTQIIQDHVANVSANRNIVTDLLTTQGDNHGYVSMGLALSIDAKAGFDVLNMTGSRSDINYRLTGLEFPELVEFYKQHPTTDLPTPTSLEITRLTDGAMLDLKNVDFIAFDNGDAIAIAHNHTETIIGRLFHTLLNRDPAAHEWQLAQQASTAYQQGSLSAATILNWFTAQNPTLNQQNNSAYLQTLYQQTFGRDPSTAELTTALQTLDNASTSRDAIAVTLAASNEALSSINNLITAYQWL